MIGRAIVREELVARPASCVLRCEFALAIGATRMSARQRAESVRTATIVLVAYVLCVIVAAVWRFMPGFTRDAVPAIGALTAAYLGHTTRPYRAPATAGAVVLGYLIDVISGTPAGHDARSCSAMTADIARATQQRIFVRGTAMTIGYSAFIVDVRVAREDARARDVRHSASAGARSSCSRWRSSRSRPR